MVWPIMILTVKHIIKSRAFEEKSMKKIDIGSLAGLLTRLICCSGRKKANKIPILKFDLILTGLCTNFLTVVLLAGLPVSPLTG